MLLQLKHGAEIGSLFDAKYVTVVALIVVLFLYISSLAAVNILQAHITSDLGEFMNKISLLSEILASILFKGGFTLGLEWAPAQC
ncbi:unnamed protein product [Prunus armeniaca]